jgi:malate:Na+ symporter
MPDAPKFEERPAQTAAEVAHAKPAPRSSLTSFSGMRSLLMNFRIGIIPLPAYLVLLALIVDFALTGKLTGEINMMMAALALGGFTCAEIGKRIPVLGSIGGAALVTIFLPSFLVEAHFLPAQFIETVTTFTTSTNFIYLFIAAVVVGSILSMDRKSMIEGFLKICVPLAAGSILAIIVGVTVGWLTDLGAWRTLFFVVIPVMAGGVGEGAIPLSVGYSEILGQDQGHVLAQLLPLVFFGNVTAILISGLLNNLGKRYPHLTGNGRLQPGIDEQDPDAAARRDRAAHSNDTTIDISAVAAGGITAITIYLVGVMLHSFIGLPAPVGMLFIVVLLKLTSSVPPILEEGARVVFRFFVIAVTYPLLFAFAVAQTPWHELVAAFHLANLITIVATVATLTASGYFVGRWLGMYPIEAAIVNATHSGLGGTGDVMILSAAERMELMPFAQVATRIGGAITVTLALIALSRIKPL